MKNGVKRGELCIGLQFYSRMIVIYEGLWYIKKYFCDLTH